jgi:DNA-binding CsgD family transcriptional regulator/tetratricopeptide (TPR) repeat protein
LGGTRQALSARELEVLRLVVAGRSNGEIGRALFISKKTASVHVANIKAKLGAETRIEIVTVALAMGVVDPLLDATPAIGPPNRRTVGGNPHETDASRAAGQLEAVHQGSVARPGASPASGRTFVGREAELQLLERAFERASGGQAGLVMVVGEPGIGKTRIAAELATRARLRRAQVLWGRCYESAGAPPYWPFVQALRGYVRDHEQDQLGRQLGGVAAALAEIVPEINDKLPGLAPLPTAEPQQARFRLFDSVSAFLRAASAEQPILFVLDDLHWADAGTLALLEFLARDREGSSLLVVGTFRELELTKGHPLIATLAELTRELSYERVTLKGLDAESVGRFIVGTAAIAPTPALVEAVFRHTEGNPLFVTEVVRLLVSEGALSPERLAAREQPWSVRIPDGVREVIGRRLERLSEHCQEVLRTAALLGREFTIEQLAALSDDLGEDRLLAVLEEALAARLIEELPRAVGHFAFTHALVQDTLVAQLSATRRARLHGRIGETLERLYGERAAGHAAELAYHFREAGPAERERFVRYTLRAGGQALAAHAFEEAIEQFSQAISAMADAPIDASAAAAHLGLGQAQAALTPMSIGGSEAVGHIARAFEWYLAAGDDDRAVAAATELPMAGLGMPPAARDMVVRALRHVPPDSHGAGRLLAYEGWYLGTDDADYEAAAAAFARALRIARQHNDRSLEVRILAHWSYVDWGHLRRQECLEHSRAAVELVVDGRDDYGAFVAHAQALRASMLLAEHPEALAYAAVTLAIAERLRIAVALARTCAEYANLYMAVGDWNRARPLLERGFAADPHSGYEDLSLSSRPRWEMRPQSRATSTTWKRAPSSRRRRWSSTSARWRHLARWPIGSAVPRTTSTRRPAGRARCWRCRRSCRCTRFSRSSARRSWPSSAEIRRRPRLLTKSWRPCLAGCCRTGQSPVTTCSVSLLRRWEMSSARWTISRQPLRSARASATGLRTGGLLPTAPRSSWSAPPLATAAGLSTLPTRPSRSAVNSACGRSWNACSPAGNPDRLRESSAPHRYHKIVYRASAVQVVVREPARVSSSPDLSRSAHRAEPRRAGPQALNGQQPCVAV